MTVTAMLLNDKVLSEISVNQCLNATQFDFGTRYQGKVRDCYTIADKLVLVTTDRLSAFDRIICSVPFKGQVLNLLTHWWYQNTLHIIKNVSVALPHPNVMIAKKCKVFPVEFIMRGYMTGSTATSLWSQYQKGEREFDDCKLPDNLPKNAKLPRHLLTPTTKSDVHDEPITCDEIIKQGLMTKDQVMFVSKIARELFAFASQHAEKKGLILVDTKYEFGLDENNNIVIVDELHTPDSSRYWLQKTYQERLQQQQEPESFDKEILRLWMKANTDPYHASTLPAVPEDVIQLLTRRYIELYELITGEKFTATESESMLSDIEKAILPFLTA